MNRRPVFRTLPCVAAAVLSLAALTGCERRAAEPPAPSTTGDSASQPPASPLPETAPMTPPASAASQ